jgi:hypothetical protein
MGTLGMRLFAALIALLFIGCGESGLGEDKKETTSVITCTVEGENNTQNCGNEGSNIFQQIAAAQSDSQTPICCECFGNDSDGLSDEECLGVTQCSELFNEVALDKEKRQILCPGNALDTPGVPVVEEEL